MSFFASRTRTTDSNHPLQRTPIGRLWLKYGGSALGRIAFSFLYALKAPYFLTIFPYVRRVELGVAELTSPSWFLTHNHIGTYHALASGNSAEAAMGLAMESAIPPTHRWLPKSMTINYVRIAKGSARTIASLPEDLDFSTITTGTNVPVTFSVFDSENNEFVNGTITLWVTPKPPKS